MRQLFGTDGIRGVANIYPMTPEMTLRVGRAVGYMFQQNGVHRHKIIIGKDSRISGYVLESALTAGICSMGVDVHLVAVLPTPAVAHLVRSFNADAGIMISASHNPFPDNGIKLFSKYGYKLPDHVEQRIEELVLGNEIDDIRPTGEDIGKAFRIKDAVGRYIEFVKSTLDHRMSFAGMKIAVDCANGAAYKVTATVLEELDADVIVIGDEPNGLNINEGCGSLYLDAVRKVVLENRCDIGIAHDGDADRVLFIDANGQEVNGDQIMAICALHLAEKGKLAKNTLVTTVMSNLGLRLAMEEASINVVQTAVGDRYVLETMHEKGYNLGGEQSGHIIFFDYNTTGDGVITALQLLQIMQKTQKPLTELAACMHHLPQVLINVNVQEKRPLDDMTEVVNAIREVEAILGKRGRILVRYSGTENKVRVMVEGENEAEIQQLANHVAEKIKTEIGV